MGFQVPQETREPLGLLGDQDKLGNQGPWVQGVPRDLMALVYLGQ